MLNVKLTIPELILRLEKLKKNIDENSKILFSDVCTKILKDVHYSPILQQLNIVKKDNGNWKWNSDIIVNEELANKLYNKKIEVCKNIKQGIKNIQKNKNTEKPKRSYRMVNRMVNKINKNKLYKTIFSGKSISLKDFIKLINNDPSICNQKVELIEIAFPSKLVEIRVSAKK